MAVYSFSAANYEVGVEPLDKWDKEEQVTSILIADDGGGNGKYMDYVGVVNQHSRIGFPEVPDLADVEILMTVSDQTGNQSAMVRWASTRNPATHIIFNSMSDSVRIRERVDGVLLNATTETGNNVFTLIVGVKYKIRMQIIGDTAKFKIWLDADEEPGTWRNEASGFITQAAGDVGLHQYGGVMKVYDFMVLTGADIGGNGGDPEPEVPTVSLDGVVAPGNSVGVTFSNYAENPDKVEVPFGAENTVIVDIDYDGNGAASFVMPDLPLAGESKPYLLFSDPDPITFRVFKAEE